MLSLLLSQSKAPPGDGCSASRTLGRQCVARQAVRVAPAVNARSPHRKVDGRKEVLGRPLVLVLTGVWAATVRPVRALKPLVANGNGFGAQPVPLERQAAVSGSSCEAVLRAITGSEGYEPVFPSAQHMPAVEVAASLEREHAS